METHKWITGTIIIIIIRHGHILLMVHHTITFVLGLVYIYFWLMARSLFLMVTTFCTMTIFDDKVKLFSPQLGRVDDISILYIKRQWWRYDIFLSTVGPGWVGQRKGREQDFHCQGASGTSRRERSVEKKIRQNIDKDIAWTYFLLSLHLARPRVGWVKNLQYRASGSLWEVLHF